MSVRSIEAEVSIKSGISAECTIGREVIVEVHEDVNLESLTVTANGSYEPSEGVDGYDRVVVSVPPTIPEIEALTVTEDGVYQASGDGYNPVTVNTGVGALRQEIANAETASGCSPLVDGLTALTTYANEVTGQEDETLSDAVETLASKYGKAEFNPFAYGKRFTEFFRRVDLPENIVIDFEGNSNISTFSLMFYQSTGIKNITIRNLVCENPIAFDSFLQSSTVETLTFENCVIRPSSTESFGRACANLVNVFGEIDCSGCTNVKFMFPSSPKMKHFRFKQNSISQNLTDFAYNSIGVIEDDSWISVANALNPEAQKSINLKSNNRIDCNNIVGDNNNGTFVADENGSMTLMDFIITVKGWTVT